MTTVFHSNDISCGGCTATIEAELAKLSGVSSVKGDPDTKLVTVEHEAGLSTDAILKKLDEVGFASTVAD